jgi:hypothetical protein
MSEYKGIKGFSIQSLSADPADPNIGQVWYNSTSGSWKVTSVTTSGSWASGGNLNTARRTSRCSRNTNMLLYILVVILAQSNTGATEEYNGSAWTTSPAAIATLSTTT